MIIWHIISITGEMVIARTTDEKNEIKTDILSSIKIRKMLRSILISHTIYIYVRDNWCRNILGDYSA
jgi:hypothetical protein